MANIYGTGERDTLEGSASDDVFYGSWETDWLDGKGGNDTLDYTILSNTYSYLISNGTIKTGKLDGVNANLATKEVRKFLVIWSDYYEEFLTISNGDVLRSSFRNVIGTNFSDTLVGDEYNNSLYGRGGGDTIWGGAGNDWLEGGDGNDFMYGEAGNDTLWGGAGNDWLDGGDDHDRVYGQTGNDTLFGGAGNDWLEGGDDTLKGGADTDLLLGGDGQDMIYGEDGNDTVGGQNDDDQVWGGKGNDLLFGDGGNDSLYGEADNDTLEGQAGNDSLYGGAGSDTYKFLRGGGMDIIQEDYDATPGNTDLLQFLFDINANQLWFRQAGNNLEVSVIGTADKVTMNNWYLGSGYHVEQVRSGDNKLLLDTKVQNLVQAMAAFAPPPMGQTNLTAAQQAALAPVLAANWQ